MENENWNRNNEELLRLTTGILGLLAQIAFMERWFIPHLQPSQNPVALALADKSINQISDRSVAEELATLANVLNSTRQRRREIL
jgi:hypothetical protein